MADGKKVDWRQGRPSSSKCLGTLRARGDISLRQPRSSHVVNLPLEGTPRPSATIGLTLPPRGSGHLAVYRTEGTVVANKQRRLPSADLGPTSEFDPCSCCPRRRGQTHFHEVSRPRSATFPSRATTPELCLPESCCVFTLTMRLDALLPQRPPWCHFNQARSRGTTLQSLPKQRSPSPLGTTSPHAISYKPDRSKTDTKPVS
jgi:hypothetical protein